MVARAPDKDIGQQVGQFLFTALDQFEEFFKVRRVNGQVRPVVLMEKLDLVINVPCAFVPGSGGQETATAAG
jgi:hypothetical protein